MMNKILVFAALIALAPTFEAQSAELTIGEMITLQSIALKEDRQAIICLPKNYEKEAESYPVVYVLDGRDHYLHAAGAIRFLVNANLAPNMIVVAVLNVRRTRDMTIPDDKAKMKGGGGADRFTSFLGDELIPFVDANYRTENFRVLAGHSLAGLFTVHTLLNKPDHFNAYIAVSPSVWWKDEYILDRFAQVVESQVSLDKFLYLTSCRENSMNILMSVNNLIKLLEAKAPAGLAWEYEYMPDDVHSTTFYRAFYGGLEWLFRGWRFDSTVQGASAHRMRSHYADLSARYDFQCKPAEKWLIIIGYEALRAGRTSDAIEYFKYYTECYPKSANSYDSLGEAYMESGDTLRAIENYEKSLEFNPNNTNATRMLNKLRGEQ
jgi:predicted alpha/beta superfamily hydrolase